MSNNWTGANILQNLATDATDPGYFGTGGLTGTDSVGPRLSGFVGAGAPAQTAPQGSCHMSADGLYQQTGAGTVAAWTKVLGGAVTTAIAGARVLTNADSGGTYAIAQSSAYNITLPSSATEGLAFRFWLQSAGAFAVTITAAAGAMRGTIVNDVTSVIPATGATLTLVSGTAAIGDNIEAYSSNGLWFIRAVTSAAGGITIA